MGLIDPTPTSCYLLLYLFILAEIRNLYVRIRIRSFNMPPQKDFQFAIILCHQKLTNKLIYQ